MCDECVCVFKILIEIHVKHNIPLIYSDSLNYLSSLLLLNM